MHHLYAATREAEGERPKRPLPLPGKQLVELSAVSRLAVEVGRHPKSFPYQK